MDEVQATATPTIGILGWEAGNPDTLAQLEAMPGNIAHPRTFNFPVLYWRVPGACYETVVVRPTHAVLSAMITGARELAAAGVKAITTSCGFNAIFQQELAASVAIPVFASSLMLVPLVYRMLRPGRPVGILTADQNHLTQAHLRLVGIDQSIPVCIQGIADTPEFSKVRSDPTARLDAGKFVDEVVDAARHLVAENGNLGAIVLECTDLPPAASAIRTAVGLPVFDIVSLTNMVHEAVTGDRWGR